MLPIDRNRPKHPNRCTVYLLHASDEPFVPRYVGQTSRILGRRLLEHNEKANGNASRDASLQRWIRTVQARGAVVEISPVVGGLTREQALELESQMIEYLRPSVTNGGVGKWMPGGNPPPVPLLEQAARKEASLVQELSLKFQELSERLGPGGLDDWERDTAGCIVRRSTPQE